MESKYLKYNYTYFNRITVNTIEMLLIVGKRTSTCSATVINCDFVVPKSNKFSKQEGNSQSCGNWSKVLRVCEIKL